MLLNACSMSHILLHSQSSYLPVQKRYQSMFLSTKEIALWFCFVCYLLAIFLNIGWFKRGDEAKVHISKSL